MDAATLSPSARQVGPLERTQIEHRLGQCARLPSLGSISSVLCELLNAEHHYITQVCDVIRRDPSMTTRLLRLVNSVYYGLSTPVSSIEEAVFYLGLRQVRQLATATPIIEDLQKLTGHSAFFWRDFWQHCIATAILTTEIVGYVQPMSDEMDYVAGLLHDVGKIVMAAEFPDHFAQVRRQIMAGARDLRVVEREVLGVDHTELGALYLEHHQLPEAIIETARWHHQPTRATAHPQIVAAVHIADLLSRHASIGDSGEPAEVSASDWQGAAAWGLLFSEKSEQEKTIATAGLQHSLERLPSILEGLV